MIGEIQIGFNAAFNSQVLQSIPPTTDVSQTFQGNLQMDAQFSYSSFHEWSYTASYDASLAAQTSVGTQVSNLGLRAFDKDIFDDEPRKFPTFNICMTCVLCHYSPVPLHVF